jgi:hypothetical protein
MYLALRLGKPEIIEGFADKDEARAYVAGRCRDEMISDDPDNEACVVKMTDDAVIANYTSNWNWFFWMVTETINLKERSPSIRKISRFARFAQQDRWDAETWRSYFVAQKDPDLDIEECVRYAMTNWHPGRDQGSKV